MDIKQHWPRLVTTLVSGAQGFALVAYGIGIAVVGLTVGLEGSTAASEPLAVTVEVITFCLFGVGLLLVAWGLYGQRGWSRLPFVVAQLLAFTVGIPLLSSTDSLGFVIGLSVTVGAAAGLVALIVGVIRAPDAVDLRVQNNTAKKAADAKPADRLSDSDR